jgi:hypothetical protein
MQLATMNKVARSRQNGGMGTFWRFAIPREDCNETLKQDANRTWAAFCSNAYLHKEMTSIVSIQTLQDVSLAPGSVGKLVPNTKAIILDEFGKSRWS